jgi:hypothetical protein
MKTTIGPCPFCGNVDGNSVLTCISDVDWSSPANGRGMTVKCDNPRCCACGPLRASERAAVSAWDNGSKKAKG